MFWYILTYILETSSSKNSSEGFNVQTSVDKDADGEILQTLDN